MLSDDLHPIRCMRRFPAVAKIVRRAARRRQDGRLRLGDGDWLSAQIDRVVGDVPLEERRFTQDRLFLLVWHLAHFIGAGRRIYLLASPLGAPELGEAAIDALPSDMACYLHFGGHVSTELLTPPDLPEGAYVTFSTRAQYPRRDVLLTSQRRIQLVAGANETVMPLHFGRTGGESPEHLAVLEEQKTAERHLLGLIANALHAIAAKPEGGESVWPADAPPELVGALHGADTPKRRRVAAARLVEGGFLEARVIGPGRT